MRMLIRRTHITRGGQISVPAPVRKRWKTNDVVLEDHGNELVVRPASEDPISELVGFLVKDGKKPKMTADEMRRQFREEEAEAEERKWRDR